MNVHIQRYQRTYVWYRLLVQAQIRSYAYHHKNKASAHTFRVKPGMLNLWQYRETTRLQGLTLSRIRILVYRVDDPGGGYRRHPSWSFVALS